MRDLYIEQKKLLHVYAEAIKNLIIYSRGLVFLQDKSDRHFTGRFLLGIISYLQVLNLKKVEAD